MAEMMVGIGSGEHIPALWGRSLRFVLLDRIRAQNTMTVAAMVAHLASMGFEVNGRPSKVISDALRWEVARGRVIRVRRGVYRYAKAPKTTARRVQIFAEQCRKWIVAVMRSEEPPPTPVLPADRWEPPWRRYPPGEPSWPPWLEMGWLWTA